LRQFYGDSLQVSPLTTVIDPRRYLALSHYFNADGEPNLAYLYRHQLDEADLIAVNKIDLVDPATVQRIEADLQERFPHARTVAYSATRGDGLNDLVALWTGYTPDPAHRPFAVDYDRYGAAEAELAWTNQTFTITAAAPFSPAHWNEVFLREFAAACRETGSDIGHVKLRITTAAGSAKASLVDADTDPSHDGGPTQVNGGDFQATTGDVTLNARVRTDPGTLSSIIDRATGAATRRVHTNTGTRHGDIFRPGFPVPVHRM
jgi:G3E family GTPase